MLSSLRNGKESLRGARAPLGGVRESSVPSSSEGALYSVMFTCQLSSARHET